MAKLPASFPPNIDLSSDYNPAIRLFGKRFFSEQTILEFAAEFMGIIFYTKWIEHDKEIVAPLPSIEDLRTWPNGVELKYNLPIKLNLKLFAFLGVSRVDTRHDTHIEQYKKLCNTLRDKIHTNDSNAQVVIEWLEGLLKGFQGAGFNRTWCAQTFFPVSKSLLAKETIWNISTAKKDNMSLWAETIDKFSKYYSSRGHNFMARGGEVIYLQLCNAFSEDQDNINKFIKDMDLSNEETDLCRLHSSLQEGLLKLGGQYTDAFDELVYFIEILDKDTHLNTNRVDSKQSCQWCPKESWQEGYLFAVEINRLLNATLDPAARVEMLMTGCVLQVMRSLCAQSVRYQMDSKNVSMGSALNYAWVFTSQDASSKQQKLASQKNLQVIQGIIQKTLRNDDLRKNAKGSPKWRNEESMYREVDSKYGHKLFLTLGKKLNIISPKRGPGARFVITDKLLRYLVISLVEPGKRCTYKTFLSRLYMHYGIAVEGDELKDAITWSSLPVNNSYLLDTNSWLSEMLCASGFLTGLSDACSIVSNNCN